MDAAGAVAAVDVAAVGHVELGLGRRGPLVAAVAVDPEEGHGGDLHIIKSLCAKFGKRELISPKIVEKKNNRQNR